MLASNPWSHTGISKDFCAQRATTYVSIHQQNQGSSLWAHFLKAKVDSFTSAAAQQRTHAHRPAISEVQLMLKLSSAQLHLNCWTVGSFVQNILTCLRKEESTTSQDTSRTASWRPSPHFSGLDWGSESEPHQFGCIRDTTKAICSGYRAAQQHTKHLEQLHPQQSLCDDPNKWI